MNGFGPSASRSWHAPASTGLFVDVRGRFAGRQPARHASLPARRIQRSLEDLGESACPAACLARRCTCMARNVLLRVVVLGMRGDGPNVRDRKGRYMMRMRSVYVLLASFTVGLGLCAAMTPAEANAATLKVHASTCFLESTEKGGTEGKQGLFTNNGVLQAWCPFEERDIFPRTQVSTIEVFGSRQDNEFVPGDLTRVKVCRSFATTDAGECGAQSSLGGTQDFELVPDDMSAWRNQAGYPYVYVNADGRDLKIRGLVFQ